ncbi:hypothetical protein WIW89_12195 [Stygiolobus sp. CP850M]
MLLLSSLGTLMAAVDTTIVLLALPTNRLLTQKKARKAPTDYYG